MTRIDTNQQLTARVSELEKAVRLLVTVVDQLVPYHDEHLTSLLQAVKYHYLDGMESPKDHEP